MFLASLTTCGAILWETLKNTCHIINASYSLVECNKIISVYRMIPIVFEDCSNDKRLLSFFAAPTV